MSKWMYEWIFHYPPHCTSSHTCLFSVLPKHLRNSYMISLCLNHSSLVRFFKITFWNMVKYNAHIGKFLNHLCTVFQATTKPSSNSGNRASSWLQFVPPSPWGHQSRNSRSLGLGANVQKQKWPVFTLCFCVFLPLSFQPSCVRMCYVYGCGCGCVCMHTRGCIHACLYIHRSSLFVVLSEWVSFLIWVPSKANPETRI